MGIANLHRGALPCSECYQVHGAPGTIVRCCGLQLLLMQRTDGDTGVR